MAGGQHGHKRFLAQSVYLHPNRIMAARPDESAIQMLTAEAFEQRGSGGFFQGKLHLREFPAEGTQGGWHRRVESRRTREANAQPSHLALGSAPGGARGALCLDEQRPRLGQKSLPCLGQFRPVREAAKERGTQFVFQAADLLAKRWLSDAHLGRRPGKVQLLGHRQKVANVAQFHDDGIAESNRD